MNHFDLGAGQFFKLFGMQRGGFAHDRNGVGKDGQRAALVVLLRSRFIAGGSGNILFDRKFFGPLVGQGYAAHHQYKDQCAAKHNLVQSS